MEKEQKAQVTLMQQLNTIRAAKAKKRTENQTVRRAVYEKKQSKEAAARMVHTKEERKRKYIIAGQAEKFAKKQKEQH
jgi:hypothetical protein